MLSLARCAGGRNCSSSSAAAKREKKQKSELRDYPTGKRRNRRKIERENFQEWRREKKDEWELDSTTFFFALCEMRDRFTEFCFAELNQTLIFGVSLEILTDWDQLKATKSTMLVRRVEANSSGCRFSLS